MEEKAIVCSSQEEFAQVKVDPREEVCPTCSARNLCIGQQKSKGTITALNPLSAQPGDEVKIEIPERSYSRELMVLFGVLLLAALFGLILGQAFASLLPLPSSLLSLIGLLLGLLGAGLFLGRYFQKAKRNKLYPVIKDIIKKGASHG